MFLAEVHEKSLLISSINPGRINLHNVLFLKKLVIEGVREHFKTITINLRGIKFIDSESFSVINQLVRQTGQRNIELTFANANEELLELFELIPEAKAYTFTELLTEQMPVGESFYFENANSLS